jgi:hypothetical protein
MIKIKPQPNQKESNQAMMKFLRASLKIKKIKIKNHLLKNQNQMENPLQVRKNLRKTLNKNLIKNQVKIKVKMKTKMRKKILRMSWKT